MRHLLWLWLLLIPLVASAQETQEVEVNNFRVEAQISEDQPYVGQPIVYSVRFFSRLEATNGQFIEPDFAGFGRSSTEFPPVTSTETIDGVPFVVTVQQIVLIPLRPGIFTIEPFHIAIPETPFQEAVELETPSFEVVVQAVPDNAPVDYNNAIGQFEVEALVSRTEAEVGEALTLEFTVTGTGNLEQITAPSLDLPSAWRSSPGETTLNQETPTFGSKVFRWTLIPTLNGPQIVPPISFTSFNPQNGRYETRQTSMLTIRVTGQPLPSVPEITPTATPAPEVTEEASAIVESFELKPIQSSRPPTPPATFWLLWIFPPLIWGGVWFIKRRKETPVRPKPIRGSRALQIAQTQLEAAQSLEPKTAYQQVAAVVLDYLSAKSGLTITLDNLHELTPSVQQAVQPLIEEAQAGQYAPITESDRDTLIQQAKALVQELEATWNG
ncbi:MAG: BatD family protein [Anaerolineae bacterium]|nr:BatD family protein [Anaerolineae bacterium]